MPVPQRHHSASQMHCQPASLRGSTAELAHCGRLLAQLLYYVDCFVRSASSHHGAIRGSAWPSSRPLSVVSNGAIALGGVAALTTARHLASLLFAHTSLSPPWPRCGR